MKLSKIEKSVFEKINVERNLRINNSVLESFDEFYSEDMDFRIELINKLISLLNEEKELIKVKLEEYRK
jgi:hypothetical protein